MKHEIRIFLTALVFYTRLPLAAWVGHHPYYLSQATRYLPVIGWLVAWRRLSFWLRTFFFLLPWAFSFP
jgi:adenosylcobinamide-GDP ribazoletransferase